MKAKIIIALALFSVGAAFIFTLEFSNQKPAASVEANYLLNGSSINDAAKSTVVNAFAESVVVTNRIPLRDKLDQAYVQGGSTTTADFEALKSVLAGKLSSDERVSAIRLLGSVYLGTTDLVVQNSVRSQLEEQIQTQSDPTVAKAAVFVYSRLSFNDKSRDIVNSAYVKGLLSPDEYFGELVHISSVAPTAAKLQLLSEVSDSKNRYASQLLANLIASNGINIATNTEKNVAKQLLQTNEPIFNGSPSNYGLSDAALYEQWLFAVETLNKRSEAEDITKAVLERLSRPDTDPRKILTFFLSPLASTAVKSSQFQPMVNTLKASAEAYAKNNANAPLIQQAAKQMNSLF